jgi:putative ABC transport system permease protein
MRQLFTDSLVISVLGGALGVLFGWVLTSAVPILVPADFPRLDQIQVDGRFVTVAALAAMLVGTLSALIPAARTSRADLATSMQVGGPRSVGTSGRRVRRALLAVEAAFAVILLVGAALLARSFVELIHSEK